MKYWYLATPYTRFPGGIEAAYRAACEQTAILVRAGIPVFSPIAHTHPIAVYGGLDPLDWDMWMRLDEPMMASAHGLIMCRMPSWRDSRGMEQERQFFYVRRRPIVWMDPGLVPLGVRS